MKNIFYLLIFYNIIFIIVPNVNCKRIFRKRGLPKIDILNWLEAGDYTWKNGNELEEIDYNSTVYFIPNDVIALVLRCSASYPVQFDFQQLQSDNKFDEAQLWGILSSTRTYRIFSNMNDPSTFKHGVINIVWGTSSAITGNYICQSIENLGLQSNLNIFFEGNTPPYFLNAGTNRQVSTHNTNGKIIIPCILSVHQDEIDLNLLKEMNVTKDNNETALEYVELDTSTPNITYDQFKGFIINFDGNSTIEGKYKCITQEMDDYIVVQVISDPIPKKTLYKEKISKGTLIHYEENTSTLTCCSNSGDPPKFIVGFCSDSISCKHLRSTLESANPTQNYYSYSSPTTNGSCTNHNVHMQSTLLFRCVGDGIDMIRLLVLSIEKYYTNGSQLYAAYSKDSDIDPLNLIRIYSEINHTPYMYEDLMGWFGHGPNNEFIGKFYVGQNISFKCDTSPYLFADGAKITVQFNNSEDSMIQGQTDFDADNYVKHWSFYQNTYARRGNLLLNINMISVTCNAPMWYTQKFVKKIYKFQVHKPILPSWKGDSEETLIWTLNSTDPQQIECEIIKGDPQPNLKLMKEGKEILGDTNLKLEKTNTSILLSFVHIAYGVHGDYVCVATNLAGSYEKTFHIYIEEPHPWTETIIIIFVSLGIVVVIGIVIWRIKVQRSTISDTRRRISIVGTNYDD